MGETEKTSVGKKGRIKKAKESLLMSEEESENNFSGVERFTLQRASEKRNIKGDSGGEEADERRRRITRAAATWDHTSDGKKRREFKERTRQRRKKLT